MPLICTIVMFVTIMLLKTLLINTNMFTLFPATIIIGTVVYIISYYIKDKSFFIELKSMLRER